jgi:hypothetical protein
MGTLQSKNFHIISQYIEKHYDVERVGVWWNDIGTIHTIYRDAIRRNDLETVRAIIEYKFPDFDIDDEIFVGEKPCTPLFLAVYERWPSMVKLLVENGANLTIECEFKILRIFAHKEKIRKKDLLTLAFLQRNREVISYLLTTSLNPTNPTDFFLNFVV